MAVLALIARTQSTTAPNPGPSPPHHQRRTTWTGLPLWYLAFNVLHMRTSGLAEVVVYSCTVDVKEKGHAGWLVRHCLELNLIVEDVEAGGRNRGAEAYVVLDCGNGDERRWG